MSQASFPITLQPQNNTTEKKLKDISVVVTASSVVKSPSAGERLSFLSSSSRKFHLFVFPW